MRAGYATQVSVDGTLQELRGPASDPPTLSISHASQTLNLITINLLFQISLYLGVSFP